MAKAGQVSASVASSPLPCLVPVGGGYRRGDPAYRRIMLGLMAGGIANFVLLYYVQPLLPALAQHYRISAGSSAAALSVSTLAMAAALLVLGPLSDCVGRVPLMRWSLVAAGVLGVASAFAPTWTLYLVLRGLAGGTLAVLPAVALAYLREEMHGSAHLRANAAYIAGTAVGGTLARLGPGLLEPRLGWTGTTLVAGGVTLVTAAVLWMLLPPSRRFRSAPIRLRRVTHNTGRTLRDPVLLGLCVVACTGMGAMVGTYNALAFRLREAPFSLVGGAPYVYLAYPVGIAAPWAARRLAARSGRPAIIVAGLGMLAVGVALTAHRSLPMIMVGLGVLTFAFFSTHSLASGAVVDRAQRAGIGVAQASSAYLLAYYLGSAFFGALATHSWESGGWNGVVVTGLGIVAAGMVAAVFAMRRGRVSPTP
jgi:YNFM family putative membrane transporter